MKTRKYFNTAGILALALIFGAAFASCGGGKVSGGTGKAASVPDFNYDLSRDGKGVVITKYTGKGGTVVIPAEIEGLPVVALGTSSFHANNGGTFTSVVIPESVKRIGTGAFTFRKSLTSVAIQGNGVEIYNGAFGKCRSLSELVFLDTKNALVPVKNIYRDFGSFYECKGLPPAMRTKLMAMGFPEP
jgi:hypothetical protein